MEAFFLFSLKTDMPTVSNSSQQPRCKQRGIKMKERNVQSKMDNRELRAKLESFAEPEFWDFSSRLIPDLGPGEMLGVMLPRLRKIAAKIAGEDWRGYLTTAEDNSFEEIMLQGMVIGCAKMPLEERLQWVRWFCRKLAIGPYATASVQD